MANSENIAENQLIVELIEDKDSDSSVVKLMQEKMEQLDIFHGDCILLKGKKQRSTVCIALADQQCPVNSIKMNLDIRINLRVILGDMVSVFPLRHIDYGKTIRVIPINDTIQGKTCNLFSEYLQPYFGGDKTAYRPLHEGDIFKIRGPQGYIEFKVTATEPKPFCVVAPETIIYFNGTPIKREDIDKEMNITGYDSIGGYKKELMAIREVIELSLKYPSLFHNKGLQSLQSILLYGPPGTGKTLIAKAIKNEYEPNFIQFYISIDCRKLMNEELLGTLKNFIRTIFSVAEEKVPAIIFFDHIDSIAPHREKSADKLVPHLIDLLDNMRENVIFIAATNKLSDIDPALRRFGRFDREICIGIPDINDRIDILRKLTSRLNLSKDVNIEQLAKETQGFVGSELASMCTDATMRKYIKRENLFNDSINVSTMNSLTVTMEDFRSVLSSMSLKSLQWNNMDNSNVSWEDIGGLQILKNNLQDMIEFPIKLKERFLKHGLTLTKGILLYGPSGCGKTLLAKAIASKYGSNFIYLNGRELLCKSTSESEINLRDVFKQVKRTDPCVFFIDELDCIARKRNDNRENDFKPHNTLFSQLLSELDNINPNKNIIVMCATNRPYIIDNAILRPGRIDEIIYIPLPNKQCRKCIIEIIMKNFPLAEDIDLDFLAENSEGFIGADLFHLCKITYMLAMNDLEIETRDHYQDSAFKIRMEHFKKALQIIQPSVSDEEIVKCTDFREKRSQNMYQNKSK